MGQQNSSANISSESSEQRLSNAIRWSWYQKTEIWMLLDDEQWIAEDDIGGIPWEV